MARLRQFSSCNEDLQKERDKCTFDVTELTHFLDGGPEKTKERKELGKLQIKKKCWSSFVNVIVFVYFYKLNDIVKFTY